MKLYTYVGSKPTKLQQLLLAPADRAHIVNRDNLMDWLKQEKRIKSLPITATFVIDADEHLWIAERGSEHVVCARGQDVAAAGEITFNIRNKQIEVVEITNQSAGYCPEPESWSVVASTLDTIGLPHPGMFTMSLLFRRCDSCGTTNIIKDDYFVCGVCQSKLSQKWNYDKPLSKRYLSK